MDRYLIGSKEDILHDLAIINEIAALWWQEQGYTVIETATGKAIVGKNSATGEDDMGALTTAWAEPMPVNYSIDAESGNLLPQKDTLWYIIDPASEPRFKDWQQYIPQGVKIKCEIVEHILKLSETLK